MPFFITFITIWTWYAYITTILYIGCAHYAGGFVYCIYISVCTQAILVMHVMSINNCGQHIYNQSSSQVGSTETGLPLLLLYYNLSVCVCVWCACACMRKCIYVCIIILFAFIHISILYLTFCIKLDFIQCFEHFNGNCAG